MTNFEIEGATLSGNRVTQFNGLNIYTTQSGRPISFEPSWFEIENPVYVSAEYAEYVLELTKQKMLSEGLYFVGHVYKIGKNYEIVTWDRTYVMLKTTSLKDVENFIFQHSNGLEWMEDHGYAHISNKVPFNKNGIVFETGTTFYEEYSA